MFFKTVRGKDHKTLGSTTYLQLNSFGRGLYGMAHILSCFYTQIMHNLKIEYLCPGSLSASHILNLLVSQ